MKKLMTVLAIMFVVVLTSFGQNSVTLGTGTVEFVLSDGTSDLVATLNEANSTIVIVYAEPITVTSLSDNATDYIHTVVSRLETSIGGGSVGAYVTTITYNDWGSGTFFDGIISINFEPYTLPTFFQADLNASYAAGVASVPGCVQDFTQTDIDNSYAAGVASVPGCVQDFTQTDIDNSYAAGAASVDCGQEWSVSDTLIAFNNGVASVDTVTVFNNGVMVGEANVNCVQDFTQADLDAEYAAGVASVPGCVQDFTQADLDAEYNLGLENGANLTVNADDMASGFNAGQQTNCSSTSVAMTASDMSVSVYPNPVASGTDINVDCPNFDRVDILSITGQIINTATSVNISTGELSQGVYFLNVWNTDGNVSATKILVQ